MLDNVINNNKVTITKIVPPIDNNITVFEEDA